MTLLRCGEVAVSGPPVVVTLDGANVTIPSSASLDGVVAGDIVWLVQEDQTLIAVGYQRMSA